MKKRLFLNDLFTQFEFEVFPASNKISDDVKLSYIKEMIAHAKSDKQATFMYFGFAIAAIAFMISNLHVFEKEAGLGYLLVFYIGNICLAVSAVFFFTYWRKIHKFQLNIISCIPSLNIERTRDLWIKLWEENKEYFKVGLLLFALGIVSLFTTILVSNIIV